MYRLWLDYDYSISENLRLWLDYDYFPNKIHDYDYDYDYSLFVIDYNRLRLHDYDYSNSAANYLPLSSIWNYWESYWGKKSYFILIQHMYVFNLKFCRF